MWPPGDLQTVNPLSLSASSSLLEGSWVSPLCQQDSWVGQPFSSSSLDAPEKAIQLRVGWINPVRTGVGCLSPTYWGTPTQDWGADRTELALLQSFRASPDKSALGFPRLELSGSETGRPTGLCIVPDFPNQLQDKAEIPRGPV